MSGSDALLAVARMAPVIRAQVEYDLAHEDALSCDWPGCHHRAFVTLTVIGQGVIVGRCEPHRLFGAAYDPVRQRVLPVQGLIELTRGLAENLTAKGGMGVIGDVISVLMKRPR